MLPMSSDVDIDDVGISIVQLLSPAVFLTMNMYSTDIWLGLKA